MAYSSIATTAAEIAKGPVKRVALIGSGWYGKIDLFRLIQVAPVEVVALCDVDSTMLSDAADEVAKRQKSGKRPKTYADYRTLLKKNDLDLVLIATPDHWHALPMIDAVKSGCDVYVQKPTSIDVVESQGMLAAARKYDRVVQVGTQRRSTPHLMEAKEKIVDAGLLGNIAHAEVCCYYHMRNRSTPKDATAPENLDYEMWTGPAPMRAYNKLCHPRGWRAFMEYSNGIVGDMCIHMLDTVRWMLGLGWPTSVVSQGGILIDKQAKVAERRAKAAKEKEKSAAAMAEAKRQLKELRAKRAQELGVEDGIIVARTDSLGAGLTKQIAVTKEPGDLGDLYNGFLDGEYIDSADVIANGVVVVKANGKLLKPARLASGLFQFRKGSGEDRVVLDCITSLQNGADLLWIETEKPHVGQIAAMVDRIREVVPDAKLVYNNSPSFNWTLSFRQQVFDAWSEAGQDVSAYDRDALMGDSYDETELALEADARIQSFQRDASREAGIFHHLITLPTYHTAALSTDNLAKEYFGEAGMLGYVAGVQRKEIRQGIACVKHQNMAGSDMGDDHKEYFSGDAALKAAGEDNTMNQFG